jgi:hypothetical protein
VEADAHPDVVVADPPGDDVSEHRIIDLLDREAQGANPLASLQQILCNQSHEWGKSVILLNYNRSARAPGHLVVKAIKNKAVRVVNDGSIAKQPEHA